jgi:hypothetical protein
MGRIKRRHSILRGAGTGGADHPNWATLVAWVSA